MLPSPARSRAKIIYKKRHQPAANAHFPRRKNNDNAHEKPDQNTVDADVSSRADGHSPDHNQRLVAGTTNRTPATWGKIIAVSRRTGWSDDAANATLSRSGTPTSRRD